uniref:Tetratricopeptide repeat protein n=1 Tax=Thermodesulfovibrio aggregans TaxID=86166 RepID=A0A7C4ELV7_9BACT
MLSRIKKDIPPGLLRIVREKKDIKKTLLMVGFSVFVIITAVAVVYLYKERIIPEIKPPTNNITALPQPPLITSSALTALKTPETQPKSQPETSSIPEKPSIPVSESDQKKNNLKKYKKMLTKKEESEQPKEKTVTEKRDKPQPVEVPIESFNMETFKGADILYRASDLEAKGHLTDAITEYKEYIRLTGKQDPKVLNKIAVLYLSIGNLSEASRYAEMALKESPDSIPVILNYGVIKAKMGDFHEAERCFRKVLLLHPENKTALYNLAFLKEKKKEFDEAMRLYEKLYQLGDPQAAEALQRLRH